MADDDAPLPSDDPFARANAVLQKQFRGPTNFAHIWEQAIQDEKNADADAGGDGWTYLGPRNVGGAVRALAQHPSQHDTWYAGTAQGGLWRTNDNGNTWQSVAEDTIGVVPVGAIAIAPTNPKFIYVGTGEPARFSVSGVGLFRSTDGGTTFARMQKPGDDDGAQRYGRLVVDPLDAERFWAASDKGLIRYEGTSANREPLPLSAGNTAVSDVVVFTDPADPTNSLIVIAGMHGQGIVRGRFNRKTKRTDWSTAAGNLAATKMCAILLASGAALTGTIGRIRLAAGPASFGVVYAVMEETNPAAGHVAGYPSIVFQSLDGGVSYRAPAGATQVEPPPASAADARNGQAFYSMVLEVHPKTPTTILLGYVRLHRSTDSGRSWAALTDSQKELIFARRGEHADIHAIVFDQRGLGSADPEWIWTANDGGVSFTDDRGATWRKRSYGIQAAQCVDITTNPRFPTLVACGMQDNGTFASYGGPTWYRLGHSDGGAAVFDPNDPRRIFTTTQKNVFRTDVAGAVPEWRQTLTDVPSTLPPLMIPDNVMEAALLAIDGGIPGANGPVFDGLIVGDPTVSNRFLVGRKLGAFITSDGASFTQINTGAYTAPIPPATPPPPGTPPTLAETTALAFGPGAAVSTDFYIGTSTGDIFFTKNNGGFVDKKNPFVAEFSSVLPSVSGFASCAVHRRIVASAAYVAKNKVILSHDGGSHWVDITGNGLPTGPVTCLVFHPSDERVLFVGTLVGVWVARSLPRFDLPRPIPTADVKWKKFNIGLAPMLVRDLEVVPETLTLRCATFARGCYEANLRGVNPDGSTPGPYLTPEDFRVLPVRLNIRDHGLDDSRDHTAGSRLGEDPRLPAVFGTRHLENDLSADIRVDAPRARDKRTDLQSERLGNLPDGAELDEVFTTEKPLLGDTNFVYVQVHNRGFQLATSVTVWLFFADASPSGAAPDIPDQFDPAAAPPAPWELAAPLQIVNIAPGQPAVAKFEWTPPLRIRSHVALLAVCTHADDPVRKLPGFTAKTYALTERHAALRVFEVGRDTIFIRDGLDDFGARGSVAWGGRSPDIIVLDKASADALTNPTAVDGPLSDLNDPRRGDRAHQGDNVVFVRVHNRTNTEVRGEIQLYQAPLKGKPPPPAGPGQYFSGSEWKTMGGPVTVTIPPSGWALCDGIPWHLNGPDETDAEAKAYVLVALVRALSSSADELDPRPEPTTVDGVDTFWRFFTRGELGNNAAFRALRFVG